jgi:gliding motility-associated-like protein
MMRSFYILLAFCLISLVPAYATHNRAGEITYEQLTQFYYKATITTYTKTSSPADRPELDIFWGDGTSSTLPRASFQDNFGGAGSDIRKNTYVGFHTYPGPSVYTMYFEDPNRNGGVVNIPNSINVPFYVESQLIISAALGFNNSPVLLQPPIDDGTIGVTFIHNANAYDPDGDSLSYHLIFCKGAEGLPIPGYAYPAASNSFDLDAITGDLVWDSPVGCGEFNVAFLIREWRRGVNIGYVERDMQINILCNNPNSNVPPVFSGVADTCVLAGTFISMPVTATDPDPTNVVTLTATGPVFDLSISPAQFNQPFSGTGTVTGTFEWQTECAHVRRQPYQVVFKAEDNDPFVNLVNLKTYRVTVVAPAPENLTAAPTGNAIQLNWDQSLCQEAVGYRIYRRQGFYGFIPGPCETGVPAYTGYSLVASTTGLTATSYLDNNGGPGLAPGTDYCYMVIAYFDDGAESYASAEVCQTLKKDLPVITNVSVVATSPVTGSINVIWSRPSDLDSIVQYPPPHEYRILRASGINGTSYSVVGTTFNLNDTSFIDNGINTESVSYTYKIELFSTVSGVLQSVGTSLPASSTFLSIAPTDNKLNLSWQLSVPWINSYYEIYRFNGVSFDSIGVSSTTNYTDTGLENGTNYCYYIRGVGSYAAPGFADPLINLSQIACATPLDDIPPCAISIDTSAYSCIENTITLSWPIPDVTCADDVKSYNIYFAPASDASFTLIATIADPSVGSFDYTDTESIAGCYYVTAVDSTGNEGAPGGQICVDFCPAYELPNVFTPDGNGLNDLFHPFPYRDVESVTIQIFSRWGLQVFSSEDPDIEWNGKTDNTGEDLPDGVYYYICKVNEKSIAGIKSRTLKGVIQLVRNTGSLPK